MSILVEQIRKTVGDYRKLKDRQGNYLFTLTRRGRFPRRRAPGG